MKLRGWLTILSRSIKPFATRASSAVLSAAMCVPVFAQSPSAPQTSRFDGDWNVAVTCPSNTEDSGAKGYVYRLAGTVRDGLFMASQGAASSPGSLRIEGQLRPDGSGEFQARGRTGDPEYAVKHPSSGTPYSYRINVQFEDTTGTGTRVEARVCNIVFAKK